MGRYKKFGCRPGKCVKCCTGKMGIPVTLPDLYRACVYAKQAEGRGMTIPEAYNELCDGWMHMPHITYGDKWYMSVPKSKMPCPNLDEERKRCSIFSTKLYVVCKSYPEGMLVEAKTPVKDTPAGENFWKSLDCMQGVTLFPGREKEVKDMLDLSTRECALTGDLLNNKMFQPISAGTMEELEAELCRRMDWYRTPEAVENLLQNMGLQKILERYMEMFETGGIDYIERLVPAEPEDRTIGGVRNFRGKNFFEVLNSPRFAPGETITMIDGKIGRNAPCPCDSGKKYKKCCGKC